MPKAEAANRYLLPYRNPFPKITHSRTMYSGAPAPPATAIPTDVVLRSPKIPMPRRTGETLGSKVIMTNRPTEKRT